MYLAALADVNIFVSIAILSFIGPVKTGSASEKESEFYFHLYDT